MRCVPQVFSMFLETLVDFVTVHREDLQDWLFVLLTQLLKKMGADLLGSVQVKVQKALDITRSEERLWQIRPERHVHVLKSGLGRGSDKNGEKQFYLQMNTHSRDPVQAKALLRFIKCCYQLTFRMKKKTAAERRNC